jgi:alkylation response protein AidB-like acyl-CoA dehydrogenase
MLLDLSADQDFFRETTGRFLDDRAPVNELRRLRDDAAGYTAEYWRSGAELGWTSLLVGEDQGGGSISGSGLLDLTLVAHEFGRHAAPGPLLPTNVVASTLSAHAHDGSEQVGELLAGLLSGESVATWCYGEPAPHDRLGEVGLEIRVEGDEVVIDGAKRPVEAAGSADQLLVTGRTGDGLTQVLVPADAPGVTIRPLRSVDLTRRFSVVTFEGVRVPASAVVGEVGAAEADVARQLRAALVILTAESVGAMQTAFDTTVEWAFDRYSFGRPLASYQALKHRFADMKTWLEGSHAISDAAAVAVAATPAEAAAWPEADELTSAAKAFIGHYGSELMHECVQLHGGIGVTFEHDIHLYLRRQTVDRVLYGTPAEHRQRVALITRDRGEAA